MREVFGEIWKKKVFIFFESCPFYILHIANAVSRIVLGLEARNF